MLIIQKELQQHWKTQSLETPTLKNQADRIGKSIITTLNTSCLNTTPQPLKKTLPSEVLYFLFFCQKAWRCYERRTWGYHFSLTPGQIVLLDSTIFKLEDPNMKTEEINCFFICTKLVCSNYSFWSHRTN